MKEYEDQHNLAPDRLVLTAIWQAGARGSAEVYQDEGDTLGYQSGEYTLLKVALQCGGGAASTTGTSVDGGASEPNEITANAATAAAAAAAVAAAAAAAGTAAAGTAAAGTAAAAAAAAVDTKLTLTPSGSGYPGEPELVRYVAKFRGAPAGVVSVACEGCAAAKPGAMLRHWYEEEGGAAGGGEAQRVLVVETPPQPTRANITLSFA